MAKLKRKVGRPLLVEKKRYRSGQITHAQRRDDARQVGWDARQRVYGISEAVAKDQDVDRHGRAKQGSITSLGRLVKDGLISVAQKDAGDAFEALHRAFLAGLPIPAQGSVLANLAKSPGDGGRPLSPLTDDEKTEQRAKLEKRMGVCSNALAAVDYVNRNVSQCSSTSVIWRVCIDGYMGFLDGSEIGLLREGLNALARVL